MRGGIKMHKFRLDVWQLEDNDNRSESYQHAVREICNTFVNAARTNVSHVYDVCS